ncbi:MAG: STAS domain-containing protein [Planctomycetaceae bacterium]
MNDSKQDSESGENGGTESVTPLPNQYALTEDGLLKVYSVGPTTVLGFGGDDVPPEFNAAHYRAAITDLLIANGSKTVAFDLTGVRIVPSGMLGLLVSLRNIEGLHPTVQVFNPSDDVQEVLQITKLNTLIEVHQVEL